MERKAGQAASSHLPPPRVLRVAVSEEGSMLHKKKLIAAALAAAAGIPALASAQTANVVFYGRLYPQLQVSRGHGSTAPGESVSTIAPLPTAANGDTGNIFGVEATNSRWGL